jgi:hypothetical protein
MKATNKTTPTNQNNAPTESKTATPNAHPPRDSSDITRATPQAKPRITEVSKPVVEIIACFANCAGFPSPFLNLDELHSMSDLNDRIEYIFDLKDNRTGRLYKSLYARREGNKWHLPCLVYVNEGIDLPLLSAPGVKWPSPSEYYTGIADYEDIIVAELNRWSRNLLALAAFEREMDEDFDDYVTVLTEMVEEHDKFEFELNNRDDGRAKFGKFPLRP